MTWYVDEILLRASPIALECVRRSGLAPFAYHVQSLDDHQWYRPDIEHGLPEGGLLVIRPDNNPESSGERWQGGYTLADASAMFDDEVEAMISPAVTEELCRYVPEGVRVPVRIRLSAAYLARKTKQPVLYYACETWAGDAENEYALVYDDVESMLCRAGENGSKDEAAVSDPLRRGLSEIGLNLSTPYFALHTRGFAWTAHRLI